MAGRASSDPTRTSMLSVGAILALALGAWGCASAAPPRPEASYRATVVIETRDGDQADSERVELLEYYSRGMRRREGRYDDRPIVVIDRSDLRVRWTLDPESRTFEETSHRRVEAVNSPFPDPFGFLARTQFEPVGSETIDGVETTVFAVEGRDHSGRAWLGPQQIPYRFVGTVRDGDRLIHAEIRYADVMKIAPDIDRFDVPPTFAGYEKRKRLWASRPSVEDASDSVEEWMRQRSTVPPPPPPAMY